MAAIKAFVALAVVLALASAFPAEARRTPGTATASAATTLPSSKPKVKDIAWGP